jgi:hypothetical protein
MVYAPVILKKIIYPAANLYGVLQNASIKIDDSGDKEFKKALTAYLRQRIGEYKIKKFKFTDSRKDTTNF